MLSLFFTSLAQLPNDLSVHRIQRSGLPLGHGGLRLGGDGRDALSTTSCDAGGPVQAHWCAKWSMQILLEGYAAAQRYIQVILELVFLFNWIWCTYVQYVLIISAWPNPGLIRGRFRPDYEGVIIGKWLSYIHTLLHHHQLNLAVWGKCWVGKVFVNIYDTRFPPTKCSHHLPAWQSKAKEVLWTTVRPLWEDRGSSAKWCWSFIHSCRFNIRMKLSPGVFIPSSRESTKVPLRLYESRQGRRQKDLRWQSMDIG